MYLEIGETGQTGVRIKIPNELKTCIPRGFRLTNTADKVLGTAKMTSATAVTQSWKCGGGMRVE